MSDPKTKPAPKKNNEVTADTPPASGPILKKLEGVVMDLAQLEVLTFAGQIKVYVNDQNAIDWKNLLAQAKTGGTARLIAATQVNIDGDTIMFVDETASPELKKAHIEATAAAQEYRRGLVQAFADLLGITKP